MTLAAGGRLARLQRGRVFPTCTSLLPLWLKAQTKALIHVIGPNEGFRSLRRPTSTTVTTSRPTRHCPLKPPTATLDLPTTTAGRIAASTVVRVPLSQLFALSFLECRWKWSRHLLLSAVKLLLVAASAELSPLRVRPYAVCVCAAVASSSTHGGSSLPREQATTGLRPLAAVTLQGQRHHAPQRPL